MEHALFPILVFLVVYSLITFELVNKAVAALGGVSVLLLWHVVDEHHAASLIDFETILLLLGMMIIVGILRMSGFFTIVSVKIAESHRVWLGRYRMLHGGIEVEESLALCFRVDENGHLLRVLRENREIVSSVTIEVTRSKVSRRW